MNLLTVNQKPDIMKKIMILFALTFFTSHSSFSQNSEKSNLTCLIAGGGKNFQMIGNESNTMIDSLFTNLPKTKRKGYIWKFKNVQIPGLDSPVTFQVHQGLSGKGNKGNVYFTTFTSEKYKKDRLAQNIDSEEPAIIIYVKRGRKHILKTEEEVKNVKQYLLLIYG
jgi:hypothetical protein